MKLSMLSFEGDKVYDKKLKEETNYCDASHGYTTTFGITQLVLSELAPLDLDGNQRLTIKLHVEQEMRGESGYHYDSYFKVSIFNLDKNTSLTLYNFKKFDITFQRYVTNLVLDVLEAIDKENGSKNAVAEKRQAVIERLENCNFHKDILLEKFSKQSRNRKYKAMVYRCLSQDIGEAIRVDIVAPASGDVVVSKWMTSVPGYILRAGQIKKTYWENNRFYVIADYHPKCSYIELPSPPQNGIQPDTGG